jgi:putative phage-type endonuclease
MSREDWLRERRNSLGGSDMGAVLGLNRWRSPYTVWADKMGLLPDQEDSEAVRIGRDLEPYVLSRFCEASGKRTRRVNAILRNLDFPHIHANVDSMIVGENAGVEAKTASALNARVFGGGEFPESYYAQCVTYLAVTEAQRWYLAVLIMGREFKIYQLTRIEDDTTPDWCESSVFISQDELDAIGRLASDFWELVEAGTPPEADGLRSTTETLDAIYADDGPEVDLEAVRRDVDLLITVSREIRDLQAVKDDVQNRIKAFMQDASAGSCELGKVTWREQIRRTLDEKQLRAAYPNLDLQPYYKITRSRVFRFTPAKKGE